VGESNNHSKDIKIVTRQCMQLTTTVVITKGNPKTRK